MKNIENYIREILKSRKLHFTLIDPDEQSPEKALKIATEAIEGGTDGIMIKGSTVNVNNCHFSKRVKFRKLRVVDKLFEVCH